jgi:AcrR family transcriptional regulator
VPNRASLSSHEPTKSTQSQRDKVVAAAVALADRDGLAAVSIRRVAAELAVRPMSIYTYITSKAELLDLMAEAVVSEVLVTKPLPSDWRSAVETIAVQSHQVFVAHPWLAAVSHQRPSLGTSALHHAEQLLAAIAPLELTAEEAWDILFLVNDYTLGHALRVAHAPPATAGSYPPFDPQQFPLLATTIHSTRRRSDDTFLAGLRRILDAIADPGPAHRLRSAAAPEPAQRRRPRPSGRATKSRTAGPGG